MPINNEELFNAIKILGEDVNLFVSVKESFKAGCVAGGCTMAGGLVGGPPGVLFGGLIGAVTASLLSKGKLKSVPEVIMYDMTAEQRNALANSLRKALEDVRIEDATVLVPLLLNNQSIQTLVIEVISKFLQSEFNYRLTVG